jgi:hypothetical protein
VKALWIATGILVFGKSTPHVSHSGRSASRATETRQGLSSRNDTHDLFPKRSCTARNLCS